MYNNYSQWIEVNNPIAWRTRSPDLNCSDFYLWCDTKRLVHRTDTDAIEELREQITIAAGRTRLLSTILLAAKITMCAQNNDENFEQLLFVAIKIRVSYFLVFAIILFLFICTF